MFVMDVAGFDQVRLGVDTEHDVDDVAQRKIGGVRTMPAAPANVIAHEIDRGCLRGRDSEFQPAVTRGAGTPRCLAGDYEPNLRFRTR